MADLGVGEKKDRTAVCFGNLSDQQNHLLSKIASVPKHRAVKGDISKSTHFDITIYSISCMALQAKKCINLPFYECKRNSFSKRCILCQNVYFLYLSSDAAV